MRRADTHRRRLLQAAMALPAAALGGCVVASHGTYYRPSSGHPGAVLKGAWCQGAAGPKSVIELPLASDVTLAARAERDYVERDRPELPLRVTLMLPPAQPARFSSAAPRIVEAASGKALGGTPTMTAFRYAELPADAWIDPVRTRPSGASGTPLDAGAPHGSASLRVALEPGFTPERLLVGGLVIARDDAAIKMPPVAMSRPASKSSVRDYRSADLQARLEAQAAVCRRETPQRACDNIVEHSVISFAADEPTGRWSGRWFVFGDGARARLEGDIHFAPRAPGRWRATSNALTVRDSAGESRQASFSRIGLALNDRIALDTPLFVGPVDGTGAAKLTIEVLLPDGAPDFEVALPDLLLGPQRVAIPLIRFERRAFDGGIEPFNC